MRQRTSPVFWSKCYDELLVGAVAADDQQIMPNDRRAGWPVPVVVHEFLVAPQDLATRRQASSAVAAEVDIDAIIVDDRCW